MATAEVAYPDLGVTAEEDVPGSCGDACHASLEDLLRSIAPDGVNVDGEKLKDTSALRWASRPDVKVYTMNSKDATHFERPDAEGPEWNTVVARVTVDLDTETVLEDADIQYHSSGHWVREIPSSPPVGGDHNLPYGPRASPRRWQGRPGEVRWWCRPALAHGLAG